MNNKELEQKIKELIKEENYFDFIVKAFEFEKEYKTSDFFKTTKMSLNQVIREAKIFYTFDVKTLFGKIQEQINNLDMTQINKVLDQFADVFGQENKEILDMIETMKDLNDNDKIIN